ncbi:MAG: vanadium-dependent haloperoxidase [Bacteroidetes bacterium]|nr:vanadium-dependent haloperoxidase [Bacteroidota bacterium]
MKKIAFLLAVMVFAACKTKDSNEYSKVTNDPRFIHDAYQKLTDVIIHDIFSPPVTARIYSYATIAGYEALIPGNAEYQSLGGQLNGLAEAPKPEAGKEYCYPLASVKAIMTVARSLTFTVEKYDEYEKTTYQKFKDAGVPSDVYDRSMAFGEAIGNYVIDYSKKDNYLQTRGLRYTVKNTGDKWVPTPPQYGDALEPYWSTIRPFVMDSSGQFPPFPVIPYSKDPNSEFRKEVKAVYETVKNLTQEQKDIAWFWDDNPFVMNVQGHVMFANKKMTPGGHWMAIVRTISKQQKADIYQSAEAYTRTAISMFDSFISCWHEKFRSEKIRPETVINADIDPKWMPYLQTPPFPEYPSGHSHASATIAEAISQSLGENIPFTDSTEFIYDHGVRSFKSVRDAAAEASISRVYGGIHYLSGCNEGAKAGKRLGEYISANLVTKKK